MEVKTSNPDWFRKVCKAYALKQSFDLIDDANLGVDPALQTAMQMGVKGQLSRREIMAAVFATGISGFGALMIWAAWIDPEPTSSLALLVAGGIGFVASGGFTILRLLIKDTPTSVSLGRNGFALSWGEPPAKQTDIHNYQPPYVVVQPPVDPYRPDIRGRG